MLGLFDIVGIILHDAENDIVCGERKEHFPTNCPIADEREETCPLQTFLCNPFDQKQLALCKIILYRYPKDLNL